MFYDRLLSPESRCATKCQDFLQLVLTPCFEKLGLQQSSEDTTAAQQQKNWDSLVLSSLKSGTLWQSTKRRSNISPPGGRVISVFSAGNCNIYLEGIFLSFCLNPPFPLLNLFEWGHLEEISSLSGICFVHERFLKGSQEGFSLNIQQFLNAPRLHSRWKQRSRQLFHLVLSSLI